MANIASAKKRVRANAKRTLRNRSVKSAVKTSITKVRRALAEGGEGIEGLAKVAISSLDRAASKGILHPNNAARRKSRLMSRLAGTAAVAAPPAKAAPAKATPAKAKASAKPKKS